MYGSHLTSLLTILLFLQPVVGESGADVPDPAYGWAWPAALVVFVIVAMLFGASTWWSGRRPRTSSTRV